MRREIAQLGRASKIVQTLNAQHVFMLHADGKPRAMQPHRGKVIVELIRQFCVSLKSKG